ncbi:MAG TPA: MFS transporter [Pirellulales bacterium]|jgi:MFS family permease|nr:MFS transporter [Pirellulales bacterium]
MSAISFETDIPARLDRLPWSRFHWLFVTALGVTWLLDGLEATVVAALGPALLRSTTLGLSARQVGLSQSMYLAGAIGGAIVFGHLADRLGRKRLFSATLLIYLSGALLTTLSWSFWSFALFRALTGAAIGGEYSAINSAVDELVPARLRGRVGLAINSTYWLGAILGAGATVWLLDPELVPQWLGWRLSFALGAVFGVAMLVARRYVPESPRWLLIHGRSAEAEAIMREIEAHAGGGTLPPAGKKMRITPQPALGFGRILHTLVVDYPGRCILGLVLIASQAFFYNGITSSYPLVLNLYFEVPVDRTGLFVLVMAVSNLLGPLVLGRLFDTVGRRFMISATYALSGCVIIAAEMLFLVGVLDARTQTTLWAVTFFFASAGASAGYLTVSEIFPLEMRALAIALFFAIGTTIGGLGAPALFGELIDSGRRDLLVWGYLAGALLMLAAAATELLLGPAAERKSLEEITLPLSAGTRSS